MRVLDVLSLAVSKERSVLTKDSLIDKDVDRCVGCVSRSVFALGNTVVSFKEIGGTLGALVTLRRAISATNNDDEDFSTARFPIARLVERTIGSVGDVSLL